MFQLTVKTYRKSSITPFSFDPIPNKSPSQTAIFNKVSHLFLKIMSRDKMSVF